MRILAGLGMLGLWLATPLLVYAQEEEPTPLDEIAIYLASSVPDEVDAAGLEEALRDAGDNWLELTAALDLFSADQPAAPGSAYENMLWLVSNATHLDRLELSSEVLRHDWEQASIAADRFGYDPASDFFKRYVLNYRLDDEPVTDWRPVLAARFADPVAEIGTESDVRRIVIAAASGFQVRERGYYGNLADPVAADNSRAGTGRELAVLTAAALRSQGYATRFVREARTGESWVEAYLGDFRDYDPGAWWPVYPQAPERCGERAYALELCDGWLACVTAGDAFGQEQVTAHYCPVGGVQLRFTQRGAVKADYEHWSINAWHDGRMLPLDDLYYPDAPANLPEIEQHAGWEADRVYWLGAPGSYTLLVGERYPQGVVNVLTRSINLQPGELQEFELSLEPPADLPLTALVERKLGGTWLFLVHDDSEPSAHAVRLLEPIGAREEIAYVALEYAEAMSDPALAALVNGVLKVREDDMLPVVILVKGGETALYRRGYDLSIADWLERALAD